MISGRDIVVLSSLEWDQLWQAHQELAARLARGGNRVLYVENLGVRSPRVSDAGRVAARLGRWTRAIASGGVREIAPGLHVCSPLALPPFGSPPRRVLNRLLLRQVHRAAKTLGFREPIVWSYLPTDAALDLIGLLRRPRSVVVYTCLADFAELTPRRDRLERAERAVLEASNLVFARGPSLAARCRRWSESVHEIELGVSLERFAVPGANRDRDSDTETWAPIAGEPLDELPRPIVGYVGAIHRHLDLELAIGMAAARPHWSWVYVGPAQVPVGELAARPNVHLVGHVRHDLLARYIERFDAGIVPYRVGPTTATVLPAKLMEYLAMGKPAVSTPLAEVRAFDAGRQVVATAEGEPDAFLAAIEAALEGDGPEPRAARRAAVAALDWGVQLERMSALIEGAGPGCGS